MSEIEKPVSNYQILGDLRENQIAEILTKYAGVKDITQITDNDYYMLKNGRQAKTLFDVNPGKFNKSNGDFFDTSKGKVQLVVLDGGKVVANVNNRRLELKIPDNWGDYVFSDNQKKELSENGYIKERITLKENFDVFIGIDKDLNSVVSMPIKMLHVPKNAIGNNNPLTDDQLKSLRNGYSVDYPRYVDSKGNISDKKIIIDRISGTVQRIPLVSGKDQAQKAEIAKAASISQVENHKQEESKKKSKGVSV